MSNRNFATMNQAVESGYIKCRHNKVIKRDENVVYVTRDLDIIGGHRFFGYHFGLFERIKVENPECQGDYHYEYVGPLVTSEDMWFEKEINQINKLGAFAPMIPPNNYV